MFKKPVMTSIDNEVHKKAQEAQLNISHVLEEALKLKTHAKDITIYEADKCEFCYQPGIKETASTINTSPNGLTWLWPDEKWICNNCLKLKSGLITHS